MPYSLFWDGPISAFNVYMEKAKIESLRKDEEAWMQGMYFMQAIGQSLSTKKEAKIYPDAPYLVKEERQKKQTQEDKAVALYNRLKGWSNKVKERIKEAPPN